MTVKELIEELSHLPQNAPVVVSEHSQYSEIKKLMITELYDNGGYYSDPFRVKDQALVKTTVYLSTWEGN